ncbi:MAG: D-2-hydroxyacid dehydrogenase [Gammaproteobacteria bacterium]|nr:D-2-hydroxyacid dehydrogenase [Gammaproteobacteria bacterium]
MSRTHESPRVLLLHDRAPSHVDIIQSRFPDLELAICADRSALEDTLDRFKPEVVFSFKFNVNEPLPHEPIFNYESVRWVHVAGAGIDHVCTWDGDRITLTNSAGVLSPYMAEYVMSAMLMVNFGFPQYRSQQTRHEWRQHAWRPIDQRTVLLVGLGHIGARVAKDAKQNGMKVLGVRSKTESVEHVDELYSPDELGDAAARADFVCLHVPLTDGTRGLIDSEVFQRMQPSAWLINTARGPVVNEADLIAALKEKQIAGAIMDVFGTEPLPKDSPLWDLENAWITPHVSDSITDWERPMCELFCDNLERFIAGKELENIVDQERGY